jgi:hypothetical protein
MACALEYSFITSKTELGERVVTTPVSYSGVLRV